MTGLEWMAAESGWVKDGEGRILDSVRTASGLVWPLLGLAVSLISPSWHASKWRA